MPFSYQAFTFESLLTSAKMTQVNENSQALWASVVGSHGGWTLPVSGHTHDDSNSPFITALGNNTVAQANIDASAVGQAELKTAQGEVSTSGAADLTLPGGEYGFYPRIKTSGSNVEAHIAITNGSASYVTNIHLIDTGGDAFAQQRYIQASPPYKIGNVLWGHFIFVLRVKSSGEVLASYEAEDPPWAYNGIGIKDSPERISSVPHPFADYVNKELPSAQEILLLDLRNVDVKSWKEDLAKEGKSILEDLGKTTITDIKTFSTYGLPSGINGFTNKIIIREGSLK